MVNRFYVRVFVGGIKPLRGQGDTVTWGQGTWPTATSGHVGKVTRGHGEMNGRDAVAPLPNLIEGASGHGDMGTRG